MSAGAIAAVPLLFAAALELAAVIRDRRRRRRREVRRVELELLAREGRARRAARGGPR